MYTRYQVNEILPAAKRVAKGWQVAGGGKQKGTKQQPVLFACCSTAPTSLLMVSKAQGKANQKPVLFKESIIFWSAFAQTCTGRRRTLTHLLTS